MGEHRYLMTKVRRDCANCKHCNLSALSCFFPLLLFIHEDCQAASSMSQPLLFCSSVSSLLSPYWSVFKQVSWRILFISLSAFLGAVCPVQPFPLSPGKSLQIPVLEPVFVTWSVSFVTMQRAAGTSPHPVCHCLAGDIRVPISDAPGSSTTLPAFQTNW